MSVVKDSPVSSRLISCFNSLALPDLLQKEFSAMSKTFLGFVCGIVFGIFDVLLMIPAPIPEADKPRAMAGAFLSRMPIGFVIGIANLNLPGWAAGTLIGLLISMPDAVITQVYIPILPVGMFGGALIGLIVGKWGK